MAAKKSVSKSAPEKPEPKAAPETYPEAVTQMIADAKANGSAMVICGDGARLTLSHKAGDFTLLHEATGAGTGYPWCPKHDYQSDCFEKAGELEKLLGKLL